MRKLLALLTLFITASVNAEILVVVGKNSPIETLNEKEVANIFLAKTNRLADGSRVTPLELSGEKQKSNFYKKISGKSPSQITSYWTTLIFTGKGKPPKAFRERKLLLDELSNNPAAITYIPADQLSGLMRVVHTFH